MNESKKVDAVITDSEAGKETDLSDSQSEKAHR
jgi:hypothetical protein